MKKIIFLILILISIKSFSQFQQSWVARYNGAAGTGSDHVGKNIGLDQYGNVYITGTSYDGTVSVDQIVTIKYNSSGVQQWTALYNAFDYNSAAAIAVDYITGDVYVTGWASTGTFTDSFITIKYNTNGVQQWVRFSGAGSAQALAIALDQAGNVYVTGTDDRTSTGNDYLTVKYNSNGVQQWYNWYNGYGQGYDWPNDIAVDDNGNVYVVGESIGNGTGFDYATVKYNSSGTQLWANRYNHSLSVGNDQCYSISIDNPTGDI